MAQQMTPAYFLIYSRGRTATQWIAEALSSVPGVMCSHGYDPDPYRADPAKKLQETRGFMMRGVPPVDEYFDMLEQKPFCAYGNIHGYDAVKLATRPDNKRVYRCAQVTRHPIARMLSFAAKWAQPDHAIQGHAAAANQPHSFPHDDRLFMAAVDLVIESDTGHLLEPVRVFRSEDLTGSRESFRQFVAYLTDVELKPFDLERIMRTPATDKLSGVSMEDAVAELSFDAFNYLRQKLRPHPALWEAYGALDYDLSFLNLGRPCSKEEADDSIAFLRGFRDD